ncbi:MAG: hypothetical protein SPE85_10850 [Prevotella sp.]|nr:hypothetical protein [Prevotella sp.]
MITFLHLTMGDEGLDKRFTARWVYYTLSIVPLPLILVSLFLLCSPRLSAQTGQTPTAGASYYIQNVYTGKYMSVDADGHLVLSDTPTMLITVESPSTSGSSTSLPDVYRLLTPSGYMSATILEQTACDGSGMYDTWSLSRVSSGIYNLGLLYSGVNAHTWLEWNDYLSLLIRNVFSPDAQNTKAQWRFLLPADIVETMTVVLDEASETYSAPVTNGKTATVKLKRTMTLNSWNTFCVPFTIPRQQFIEQFGEDAAVAEYKGLAGQYLQFTSFTGDIKAATPYLVYPTKAAADAEGYYIFNDIQTFADSPRTLNPTNDYAYIPTFYKTTAPAGAYLMSKNTLVLLSRNNPVKGFRAYFNDVTGTAAKLASSWSLDDITTGITEITNMSADSHNVYNISGQRMSSASLPAGIYIVNGKKVVKRK